jgi:hypothetical protein
MENIARPIASDERELEFIGIAYLKIEKHVYFVYAIF